MWSLSYVNEVTNTIKLKLSLDKLLYVFLMYIFYLLKRLNFIKQLYNFTI